MILTIFLHQSLPFSTENKIQTAGKIKIGNKYQEILAVEPENIDKVRFPDKNSKAETKKSFRISLKPFFR